jgi:hypothetical protein
MRVLAALLLLLACDPPIVDPAGAAIATGTTPNDLVLSPCGALVTASGDARLDVLARDGSPARAVFLGEGSQPGMVDVDDGERAVVSLFGSNEVALVSPCDERVLARAEADVVVVVDPPLVLREPTDADGDGTAELTVTRMKPRNPAAVVVADTGAPRLDAEQDVFVTFTNIFAFALGDDPMLTGPGVLARFHIEGDTLALVGALTLPCENPGGIASDGIAVVVTCSGRFRAIEGGHERQSAGGVVVVDPISFVVTDFVELADFSPGSPAFFRGDIVVGNLLGGELRRFSPELELLDSVTLAGENESIFTVINVDDDIAAVLFLDGSLVLSPFGDPIVVAMSGDGPARGLIDVAIDPKNSSDALGLLTLSAELVTVELP